MNDKYVDSVSSLAYYGSRYYDKTSMSWTQGDPLYRFAPDAAAAAPRRGDLYSFSMNNPMRYVDPDGLDSRDWGANEFFNYNVEASVAAAGAASEGGGFGLIGGDEGETFSEARLTWRRLCAEQNLASGGALGIARARKMRGVQDIPGPKLSPLEELLDPEFDIELLESGEDFLESGVNAIESGIAS